MTLAEAKMDLENALNDFRDAGGSATRVVEAVRTLAVVAADHEARSRVATRSPYVLSVAPKPKR